YTPASGEIQLRKAIAKKHSEWMGVPFEASSVTVTSGAKFVLFSALYSLVNPDDEVIIPAPFWVSYPAMVQLCRAKSIVIQAQPEISFKLTAQELESHLTPARKAFMCDSPSIPTGMVYTERELKDIAEVLRRHPQVLVL